jgi:hypothetical protein
MSSLLSVLIKLLLGHLLEGLHQVIHAHICGGAALRAGQPRRRCGRSSALLLLRKALLLRADGVLRCALTAGEACLQRRRRMRAALRLGAPSGL